MEISPEIPSCLRADGAGARLWLWLHVQVANLLDNEPLAVELCQMADRVEEIRSRIAQQGLMISGPKGRSVKNPLLDMELRYSRGIKDLWKTLGLADKGDPIQGSFL